MADNTRQRKKEADGDSSSSDSAVTHELKALNAKMDRMQTAVEKQVNSKIDKLRGVVEKLIAENQDALKKELEKVVKELHINFDLEVGILCARMEKIEQHIEKKATQNKRFDPDVSLIIAGLPQEDNEDLKAKVEDLLLVGLECYPEPELVAVEHIRARGRQPGLVKVELRSTQEKVAVLRRKPKLKSSDSFQRVYVSSAKSHVERLMDLNIRALLREIPAGKEFYMTANGRLVKRSPPGPDDIPQRTVLDTAINKHGQSFIDFLKGSKCCVLNGRLNPEQDNFTSISVRGKAVVDYIVTPQVDLKTCLEFRVYMPSQLVESVGSEATKQLDVRSKLPDHALLCVRFQAAEVTKQSVDLNQGIKRSRLRHLPVNFLCSEVCHNALFGIINQLQNDSRTQDNIDQCYGRLCDILHGELDKYCTGRNYVRKRNHRTKQLFWNTELNELWYNLRKAEKMFLSCKDSRRRILHEEFKLCQTLFDRRLQFFKRRFRRGQALQLEQMQFSNPQLFWREINRLAPQKSKLIPLEIVMENGESSFEIEQVLKKWENDYSSLYACSNDVLFNDQFLKETCKLKHDLERRMCNSHTVYHHSDMLNNEITLMEVQDAIDRAKVKKAVGVEELSNEVLKSPNLLTVLHPLFQTCFNTGITPSMWDKAIIIPIPKSVTADPRVPLNYRDISLLSTVYKLYSGVLNKRLTDYLEFNNGLVDEQNGFRKERACIDHIFISSVIRARLEEGKNTFVCFVDFKKAFDWIHRDLLEYKLLCSGIHGKFYNAIKALYKAPVACIQLNDRRTGWFPTTYGVKQGDVLSPTLFALYVNDLAQEIKQENLGISIGNINLSIL
ncbi:hypothetical protein ABVT39_007749 [Epinephelus coioides]